MKNVTKIISFLLVVILFSCSNQEDPKPIKSTIKANVNASTSNVEIPNAISFSNEGGKGGKIIANFITANMPDEVRIAGTTDIQKVKINKGIYKSNNRYQSLAVTLEFLVNGIVVATQEYNATGSKVIKNSVQAVTIDPYGYKIFDKVFYISFVTNLEKNVKEYQVIKYLNVDISTLQPGQKIADVLALVPGDQKVLVETTPSKGTGNTYTFTVNCSYKDVVIVYAIYNDGTSDSVTEGIPFSGPYIPTTPTNLAQLQWWDVFYDKGYNDPVTWEPVFDPVTGERVIVHYLAMNTGQEVNVKQYELYVYKQSDLEYPEWYISGKQMQLFNVNPFYLQPKFIKQVIPSKSDNSYFYLFLFDRNPGDILVLRAKYEDGSSDIVASRYVQ